METHDTRTPSRVQPRVCVSEREHRVTMACAGAPEPQRAIFTTQNNEEFDDEEDDYFPRGGSPPARISVKRRRAGHCGAEDVREREFRRPTGNAFHLDPHQL